jgi:hypothetical protein
MDVRTSEGRGGLKTKWVSGVLTFLNGLTGTTVQTINPATGAVAFAGAVTATGGVIGAVTGAVSGNVTGNVAGNVTGNVTGDLTGLVYNNVNVQSVRLAVTTAELNAGYTLLAAVAGRRYRIVDATVIAVGGALGTATSVEIEGTQSAGGVDLFSVAAAQLTQSAVNRPGITGTTVLTDGASFAKNDAATAITLSATGTADTITGVDVILTYTSEV